MASEDTEGRVTSFKESAEMSGKTEFCDMLTKECSEGGEGQACEGEEERNPDQYDYILTSL